MIPASATRPRHARISIVLVALVALLAGCAELLGTAPAPTPADFPAMAGILGQRGIRVDRIVSGDAGCDNVELARTAIGFDASGLDQTRPIRVHVYIFRNRAAYERVRASVDSCAADFVTDPQTFESLETSPFVVAGQGPWAPEFKAAIRAALTEAAGTGG